MLQEAILEAGVGISMVRRTEQASFHVRGVLCWRMRS